MPHGIYLLVYHLSSKPFCFNPNEITIWREIVFCQITYGAPKERIPLLNKSGCSWSIALYVMRKFETLSLLPENSALVCCFFTTFLCYELWLVTWDPYFWGFCSPSPYVWGFCSLSNKFNWIFFHLLLCISVKLKGSDWFLALLLHRSSYVAYPYLHKDTQLAVVWFVWIGGCTVLHVW